MSLNCVSLGFAGANKLLRVEYTSGPTSVRKIARFLYESYMNVLAVIIYGIGHLSENMKQTKGIS